MKELCMNEREAPRPDFNAFGQIEVSLHHADPGSSRANEMEYPGYARLVLRPDAPEQWYLRRRFRDAVYREADCPLNFYPFPAYAPCEPRFVVFCQAANMNMHIIPYKERWMGDRHQPRHPGINRDLRPEEVEQLRLMETP